MAEPITTLGLAKSASDIVKQALDYARESKNSDLAEKLIDAYRDIVELDESNHQLRRENEQLKDEISELKKTPDIQAKLRYDKSGAYFLKQDDAGEDGPYCTVCWDVDRRLVRKNENLTFTFVCDYCASGGRKWSKS